MVPRELPAAARRSLAVYNLLFPLAFLALLPSFLRRMFRRGNFRAHFGQRFARYSPEVRARLATGRWTWIQSISVGETLVALKLAQELRRVEPQVQLVLSVTTTTGFALAQDHAAEWLLPLYNPLDLRSIARRAMQAVRPERLVIIEGGIWPNLLAAAYESGAPCFLASARLSPRSASRFERFRHWTGPIFRLLERIAVPELADRARWETLGIEPAQIDITGSIKFDQPAGAASRVTEFQSLIAGLGIPSSAPIIVAGSTFPGEEKLLAESLLALRQSTPELFLILVPRHIERTPAIVRELAALPLRLQLRSALPAPATSPTSTAMAATPAHASGVPACDILLVDTTGELRDWYALATVAFIGKSLTATGGQNPAEPAILGKPIIFGPHMENFATLAQHLLTHAAALTVPEASALTPTLASLLADPAQRERMSEAARTSLATHQGATARTVSSWKTACQSGERSVPSTFLQTLSSSG